MPAVVALAVALAACSPVIAKDRPPAKRDDAQQRATGCEWIGAGYVKLPGSDTCVKVSGSARSEGAAVFGR